VYARLLALADEVMLPSDLRSAATMLAAGANGLVVA
jgi:hypothetical protein